MNKIRPNFRIAEILKEKGLPSKFLCDVLNKNKQYISNVINNKQTISFSVMAQIAAALEVPLWQLFTSPSEAAQNEPYYLIAPGGIFYKAATLPELKAIVEKLEAEQHFVGG